MSERFERIGEFLVNGTAKELFPLLCPVLEYEWLPGWNCEMLYAESGVAEMDAVFHTKETLGKVVWICITYEPNTFIEYLLVSGRDAVIRLSIGLEEAGREKTKVTWRMLFTATSRVARALLPKRFSERMFARMLEDRREQLDHYLATGNMRA